MYNDKTGQATIRMNRLAVFKTVKDSPCRLVHHHLSTARLFIRLVACPVFVIVSYFSIVLILLAHN